MKAKELRQRIAQIDGFIRVLTQECHILDERRHILAPLIQDAAIQEGLRSKLDKTRAAAAWHHLPPLFGQDLVRDLARLILDTDSRSGSLANLWQKLAANPAIAAHFRQRYGRMHDGAYEGPIAGLSAESSAAIIERWREQDREVNYAQFDKAWTEVSSQVHALLADPVAQKIKTFRDKVHAHLQMQTLTEEPKPFDVNSLGLTFNDILGYADRCQPVVADLGLLLTGTYWSPAQFAQAHAEQGLALWRALTR